MWKGIWLVFKKGLAFQLFLGLYFMPVEETSNLLWVFVSRKKLWWMLIGRHCPLSKFEVFRWFLTHFFAFERISFGLSFHTKQSKYSFTCGQERFDSSNKLVVMKRVLLIQLSLLMFRNFCTMVFVFWTVCCFSKQRVSVFYKESSKLNGSEFKSNSSDLLESNCWKVFKSSRVVDTFLTFFRGWGFEIRQKPHRNQQKWNPGNPRDLSEFMKSLIFPDVVLT